MYAVIESGGKQYRVEEGSSLLVDRIDAKQGDKVSLRPVMFRDGEVWSARKSWPASKSRRPSPSTCAGRRSKSSNTRRRRATGAAPATAPS